MLVKNRNVLMAEGDISLLHLSTLVADVRRDLIVAVRHPGHPRHRIELQCRLREAIESGGLDAASFCVVAEVVKTMPPSRTSRMSRPASS